MIRAPSNLMRMVWPNPQLIAAARRVRYFFYVLGGFFALLSIAPGVELNLQAVTPVYAVRGCCTLIAVILLSMGRFTTDRCMLRGQNLRIGWF
jgi:hypothetical protein